MGCLGIDLLIWIDLLIKWHQFLLNQNFIRMMDTKNVQYRVKGEKKYNLKRNNQIRYIYERQNQYILNTQQSHFQLALLLNQPALLSTIELKLEEADSYTLQFQYKETINHESTIKNTLEPKYRQLKHGRVKKHNMDPPCLVDKVNFRIDNMEGPKKSVIYFIQLKEFKDQVQREKQTIATHKVNNEKDSVKQKKKEENSYKKEAPKKEPPKKKASPAQLIQQVQNFQMDKPQPRKKESEQEMDLKRAIELSKKSLENGEADLNDYIFDENDSIDYHLIDFDDEVKKVLEHVNINWLEAQKKAEDQRSIRKEHRISTNIKPKIFMRCKFAFGAECMQIKEELREMIESAGGQIVDIPKDKCYFICEKMDDKRGKLCKNKEGIRYIVPNYVLESIERNKKCEINEFRPV